MELVALRRRTVVAKTSVDSDVSVEFQAGELFSWAATQRASCRLSMRRELHFSHPWSVGEESRKVLCLAVVR